jgi:hypothetical protein
LNGYIFDVNSPPIADLKTGERAMPGELINCFPESTEIDFSNGCNKLWRRKYSGAMFSLKLSDGTDLQATPNHPIMTNRGWLPINEIEKGDYLLKRVFNSSPVSEMEKNEFKATFSDLWDSLERIYSSSLRTGSALDFHGDGREDEVYTISTGGKLSNDRLPFSCECFKQFALSGTIRCAPANISILNTNGCINCPLFVIDDSVSGGRSERPACVFAGLMHSNEHTLRTTSGGDVVLPENPLNECSGNKVFVGESLDRCSRRKIGDYLLLWKIISSTGAGVSCSNNLPAPSLDSFAEVVMVASEDYGNLTKRGSLTYKFVSVVDKSVGVFSGTHVYNLQSDTGMYHANGLAVKNCRCFLIAVLDV